MRRVSLGICLATLALGVGVSGATAESPFELPPPATESRARSFCPEWLNASEPAKHALLQDAERSERGRYDAACRAAVRPALRHTLTAECRNWSKLMDFEVRHLVERVLRPCRDPDKLGG